MEGLIYIIRADARVEIGWCAGSDKRKAELQTWCPHPLEVLANVCPLP
jgi:hypothetical protein